jgi:hypothetical protein
MNAKSHETRTVIRIPLNISVKALARLVVLFFSLVLAVPALPGAADGYQIGAWYMPTWRSDAEGLHIRQSQKIYGRADAWAGIRDYAEGHGKYPAQGPLDKAPPDFAWRKPQLGYYDLTKPEVIRAHIAQAHDGGLSYFAFYWYWDQDKGKETYDTAARFLDQDKDGVLAYLLAGISQGKTAITPEDWEAKVVPLLVDRYFANPRYYRLDGRPVFFDFNLKFETPQIRKWAYEKLREATRKRLGQSLLLIKRVGAKTGDDEATAQMDDAEVDGLTCFRFPIQGPAEAFQTTAQHWSESIDHWVKLVARRQDKKLFIPCASTPFDTRPWYMIGWGPWMDPRFTDPYRRPYNAAATQGAYAEHLRSLRTTLDQYPAITRRMLLVYAWNEWGEGGALEPSAVTGDAWLRTTRDAFKPAFVPAMAP